MNKIKKHILNPHTNCTSWVKNLNKVEKEVNNVKQVVLNKFREKLPALNKFYKASHLPECMVENHENCNE